MSITRLESANNLKMLAIFKDIDIAITTQKHTTFLTNIKSKLDQIPEDNFDIEACLKALTNRSNQWTSKELISFLIEICKLIHSNINVITLKPFKIESRVANTKVQITTKVGKIAAQAESLKFAEKGLKITADGTVFIDSSFVKFLFRELQILLKAENNLLSLDALAPIYTVYDNKKLPKASECIAALQKAHDYNHCLYISTIKEKYTDCFSRSSSIDKQDAVILLGKNDADKTTAMHYLARSTFNERTNEIDSSPECAKRFAHDPQTDMETDLIQSLDLNHRELNGYYKLSSSLLVCDTPNYDNNHAENAIAYALLLQDVANKAKSLRFMVLLSIDDLEESNNRAETLLKILQPIAKNIHAHSASIYFVFSGVPSDNFFANMRKTVTELLSQVNQNNNGHEVEALLMQLQFQTVTPFINPHGSSSTFVFRNTTRRSDIVIKLAELPVMTPSITPLVPYICKTNLDSLTNQLALDFSLFAAAVQAANQAADNQDETTVTLQLNLANSKFEEIAFIHQHLRSYDQNNTFDKCIQFIKEILENIKNEEQQLFNPENPTNKLEQQKLTAYLMRRSILFKYICNTWIKSHSIKSLNELTVDTSTETIAKYHQALIAYLEDGTETLNPAFLALIESRAIQFAATMARTPHAGILENHLATSCTDENLQKYSRRKEALALCKKEEFTNENAKAPAFALIDIALSNLILLENNRLARLSVLTATYKVNQLATLLTQFNKALSIGAYHVAADIITYIEQMNPDHSAQADAALLNKDEVAKQITITKTALIDSLYELMRNNINTSANRQIYILTLIISFMDRFKGFATARGHSIIKLYQAYNNAIKDLIQRNTEKINTIIANASVNDMHSLDSLLQQTWFSYSIPTLDRNRRADYDQLIQRLAAYLIQLSAHLADALAEHLNPSQALLDEIAIYLTRMTDQAWITKLDLHHQPLTNSHLLSAIERYVLKLTTRLASLTVAHKDRGNMIITKLTIDSLEQLQLSLAKLLPDNISTMISSALENFDDNLQKTLNEYYTQAQQDGFLTIFTDIRLNLEQGNYETAQNQYQQSFTKKDDRACVKIAAIDIIHELFAEADLANQLLTSSNSLTPANLTSFMKTYQKMITAQSLHSANLIDSNTQQQCKEKARDMVDSIETWFETCLMQIKKKINVHSVKAFTADIEELTGTLKSMYTTPRDYESRLQGLHDLAKKKRADIEVACRNIRHAISAKNKTTTELMRSIASIANQFTNAEENSWTISARAACERCYDELLSSIARHRDLQERFIMLSDLQREYKNMPSFDNPALIAKVENLLASLDSAQAAELAKISTESHLYMLFGNHSPKTAKYHDHAPGVPVFVTPGATSGFSND